MDDMEYYKKLIEEYENGEKITYTIDEIIEMLGDDNDVKINIKSR